MDMNMVSGIVPSLAVTNNNDSECGIGAVVSWAGRLWYITYPPHRYEGSSDKLYSLDAEGNVTVYAGSVGGTHANRMIHRESEQLIIGPYFISSTGSVRSVSPKVMQGRLTGVARHLEDPINKVYFYTMEQGLYEVNVHTLEVRELHRDLNGVNRNAPALLPGKHGKGAYSGQGRFVVSNNGVGGVLAEWVGKSDPADSKSWRIIDRNKYTDITSIGGIFGAPEQNSSLWAMGWDQKSALLNVCDGGVWKRYRLPKTSGTYEADHGWYTEWPRIRDIGADGLLMDLQGMFYQFPPNFSPGMSAGIVPLTTHLKMVVDFTEWMDGIVMACNDASLFDNRLLGRPQSNLWFTDREQLQQLGWPAGWGGPWVKDRVAADEPSEPYLFGPFDQKVIHLSHSEQESVLFTLELDVEGKGKWTKYAELSVPGNGYVQHIIPEQIKAEWIRAKTNRTVQETTVYLHYGTSRKERDDSMFHGLPRTTDNGDRYGGMIRPSQATDLKLQYISIKMDSQGNELQRGYYEIGEDMKLRRADEPENMQQLLTDLTPQSDFDLDAASVIMLDKKGRKYRLPKGPANLDKPSLQGQIRGIREVVTERNLMNIHGTIYELPREDSGGLAWIRPICTHQRMIYDFASWRGMLVLAGTRSHAVEDGHFVASDDGQTGLWFGNVDDLWKLGHPRGEGGPWLHTEVNANDPSDPYFMYGYDKKTVQLSHNHENEVQFTIEVDFLADGSWHEYTQISVPSGDTVTHYFPEGYSAHWVRVRSDRDCQATAWFQYT